MPAPPTTHRVVTGDGGQPVLVKRASEPEAAGRLMGEAAVLRTLAHPGAVTVVGVRPAGSADGGGAELHLAWVGPHSLATVTGLPVTTAGDLVAQVASTVADLHRAGIVHGRLTADHVLLAPGGRAVLTGFADASRADARPTGPADDVAALGALLTRLVAPHDGGPVIPETRRGRAGDGGRRAALLTLADRAQADDPATRPAAADLAASIRATVGPPPKPRPRPRRRSEPVIRSTGKPRDPITGSGRRGLAGVGLGVCVVVTVGATVWLGPSAGEPEVEAGASTTTLPTSTTTTTAPASTIAPPPTTAPCPPVTGPAVADVDGDGCVEAVAIDGERVTVGLTTWRAGRPGDLAVVADWDCDGQATVASLRASTGEVFVFDRWVTPPDRLTVGATAQVEGATALRAADPDGDGCAALVAERPGGEPVTVEVAA